MQYSIEQYDKHGFLQVPVWLSLSWFFLAKAWVVFIMAGVSRDAGVKVLEVIYPVTSTLYIGLIVGAPVLILFWLLGLRHPDRKWVLKVIHYGRALTISVTLAQIGLSAYQVYLDGGRFSWANALSLLMLFWILIFVMRSRRVRDCFRSPLLN
ncbi:DUF2919 domain-containing protein [Vibrio sp. JC009]|uniref:DUF2919 domain-containing protein n=1 Tax=Vibrio sp. JC009 TaxID=2912314 RepID=UPI0023B0D3BF|nr:DUF2919 domain-containing protein [Vibrio sp. JC009]WED22519.1 DUF2919 domain-containing protein [Vibrio sp. JC009]